MRLGLHNGGVHLRAECSLSFLLSSNNLGFPLGTLGGFGGTHWIVSLTEQDTGWPHTLPTSVFSRVFAEKRLPCGYWVALHAHSVSNIIKITFLLCMEGLTFYQPMKRYLASLSSVPLLQNSLHGQISNGFLWISQTGIITHKKKNHWDLSHHFGYR